jgi:hypothetical protein
MELLEAKEQQLASVVDIYRSLGGGQNPASIAQNMQ